MIRKVLLVFLVVSAGILAQVSAQESKNSKPLYLNASSPVDARVADLVSRMTLEEKVGQICALLGWEMYRKDGNKVTYSDKFANAVKERNIGMFWATLRADPWTQKTLLTGLNPAQAAEATNALQKYAIENSRLKIPMLFAEECMHGHMAIGTTVFPTAIGQGSTWDPELIQKMATAIALETRAQGAHIGYGPILDIAREPRWSRVEETFGEDPYLIAEMGKAVVKGFQGNSLKSQENVAATLKHFAAYGMSDGGQNGGPVSVGNRELFQYFLPPFKAAVNAGVYSVMTSYNSLDGIPCTSNSMLLTDILRKQWNFKGFTVSDLGSIEGIYYTHKVAEKPSEAAAMAMNAGLDADLGGNGYGKALIEAVKNGKVSAATLNQAVSRVLKLKFEMGLFENPYVDPARAAKVVRSSEHISLSRQVARESIILLKNSDNLLPLNKNIKSVAVIGPNANNIYNQLGDYTAPQDENNIVTVLEGIKSKVSSGTKVTYVKGCAIRDTVNSNIPEAVEAARNSDVVVLVLGGSSARDFKTEYQSTGAASVSNESVSDMESGEGYDRLSLDLMGKQLQLANEIVKTGKPVVVVLIKGRPLNLNWLSENIPALVDAWYPGQEGGNAIADVLFGDYNPAGRLTVSVPRSVGQLPVYYNYKLPQKHNYVEAAATPLYPFGYGLSYTSFEYSDIQTATDESNGGFKVKVSFTVKNTGKVSGDEVVQLYIRDKVSSVVLPGKQLKSFSRIPLQPGESKLVNFTLTPEDLMLYNPAGEWAAEAGEFEAMVGASSEDIRLKSTFRLTKDAKISVK